MKRIITCIAITLIVIGNSKAQEGCGTDKVHEHLMQTDSVYRNQILASESQIQRIIRNNTSSRQLETIYTIPVVVHVVHMGEAVGTGTNISDAQILGAIQGLNNRFRKNTGDGVDVGVEFCLASRDPQNNQTTGINRVNASGVANYASYGVLRPGDSGTGASESSIKDLSKWPTNQYYNIWVVTEISNGAWSGYAYYPSGGIYDGALVARAYMTNSSYILAHELGHGFHLYHTFEGDGNNSSCPANNTCSTNGDRVCDTPPHKKNDCGTSNPCAPVGISVWDNSRYNYMSYCGTTTRFTQGQKDRVRATIAVNPRASLLTSKGCMTQAAITALSNSPRCLGTTLNLSATGGVSYSWTGPNGFSSNLQNPALTNVTLAAAGTYTVTVTDINGTTSSLGVTVTITNASAPKIIVSNNAPCIGSTLVLSASGGTKYSWKGPDRFSSSDQNPSVPNISVASIGTYYVKVTNAAGCSDSSQTYVNYLTTPEIIIAGEGSPNPNSAALCKGDSIRLNAYGATSYLWNTGETSLSIFAFSAGKYYATATNKCGTDSSTVYTVNVINPLAPTITASGTKLTSSATTGNQWYFNDVIITGALSQNYTATKSGRYSVLVTKDSLNKKCSIVSEPYNLIITTTEDVQEYFSIDIFPNPSSNGVFQLTSSHLLPCQIKIYNVLGEVVYQSNNQNSLIDISSRPKGIYFVDIQMKEGRINKKLIIE